MLKVIKVGDLGEAEEASAPRDDGESFDAAPKTKASEPLENHGKSIVARNMRVDAVPCVSRVGEKTLT
jgi:hypothetical protein